MNEPTLVAPRILPPRVPTPWKPGAAVRSIIRVKTMRLLLDVEG